MSIRTPSEWHTQANDLMSNAYASQVQALKQSETSKKAHADTFNDNLSMYQGLHGSLEGKVQTSHRLIEKLEQRQRSVLQNIDETKLSLAELEVAYHEKNAPIKLCAWRMEQRQKRPLREHVRDDVETALEDEQKALAESQQRLTEALVTTKNMVQMLVDTNEELKGDIDQKMQALSVDELCLRTTQRSFHASAGSQGPGKGRAGSSMSMTPRRGSGQAVDESARNEIRRQQEARNNDAACKRREEAAVKLRAENARLVQRCGKMAIDAFRKTEKCLQQRVSEVKLMRKRLENELIETQKKAQYTMCTISETQSQIHAIQEPIALCSTHASWRKQRADREQIIDPVEMQLEAQKVKLKKATENLRTERQNEKTILTSLGEQVERLKEDLKDKTVSLQIDVSCLEASQRAKKGEAMRSNMGTPRTARSRITTGRSKTGMMVESPMLPSIGQAF